MATTSALDRLKMGSRLTSAILTAALIATAAPLCAQARGGEPAPQGDVSTVEVHEGTSLAVAVSPDGRSLALDLQGSIWILPAKGGTAKRITDYFSDARQPVWTPDGKQVVFFSFRSGTFDLWAVNPDGSGLRQLTSGPSDDREPAISADGRFVAFASDRAGSGPAAYHIWTLELQTGALRQVTAGTGEDRMPTWSPDGREIAFSRQRGAQGTASIMAVAVNGAAERMVKGGDARLDAPSWSPDGRLAYVEARAGGSHLTIDGRIVSGSENVFPFRLSWDRRGGGYYYVADGVIRYRKGTRSTPVPFTAQLEVTTPRYVRAKRDFDTTAPRRALGILKPTLSRDGRRIAFIALGDLYVVPTTGGVPRNLTRDSAMESDPAWSPDGRQLAYTSDRGGGLPQLWVRDVASGRARRLTKLDTQPLGAAWSPDGRKIAFADVDGRWGVAGVAVIEVATGRITRLQSSLQQPGDPSWSADGKRIALSVLKPYSNSFREGTNQVGVMRADGPGELVWHVPDPNQSIDTRGGGGPAWSPDGTRMAAIYEGLLKIWPVAPDGRPTGLPRSVTTTSSHQPTWSGDSRKLLYQAADALKILHVDTGRITDVPLALNYTLAKPAGRTIVRVSALVDAVTDRTHRDKDIVIEGNRIVAIRDHDPKAAPAGTRLVDARGLTAIPGLIESHAHAQRDFGAAGHKAWLAYGVTTVRDPGNQRYDGIENREASEAGVRIGPRMFVSGPLLEWQRVYYKMGVAIAGPAHLERELELARALRYDLLKSYVRMPDSEQRRITDFAHGMGIPVTTHETFPAAFIGVDAVEHMGASSRRGYSPKQGPQGRSYQDVVALMAKTRRAVTPTLFGALDDYLLANRHFAADPRAALYPEWARPVIGARDAFSDMVRPLLPGSLDALKRAFDAGAFITAGTDNQVASNLHAEIAGYVRAGLTPFQALQTATVNPARALNLDAGTLEAGKLADIVLVDGDPRKDITATFNVRKVIANGVVYDQADLLNPSAQ